MVELLASILATPRAARAWCVAKALASTSMDLSTTKARKEGLVAKEVMGVMVILFLTLAWSRRLLDEKMRLQGVPELLDFFFSSR